MHELIFFNFVPFGSFIELNQLLSDRSSQFSIVPLTYCSSQHNDPCDDDPGQSEYVNIRTCDDKFVLVANDLITRKLAGAKAF